MEEEQPRPRLGTSLEELSKEELIARVKEQNKELSKVKWHAAVSAVRRLPPNGFEALPASASESDIKKEEPSKLTQKPFSWLSMVTCAQLAIALLCFTLWWLHCDFMVNRKYLTEADDQQCRGSCGIETFTQETNITFENLAVLRSDGKYNLQNTSGTFLSGKLTAIMGGSGAGKSTLFNVITERIPRGWTPEGKVLFAGHRIPLKRVRNLIGVVPQDDIVHEELSVEENLIYSSEWRLDHARFSAQSRREMVTDVLKRLNMEEHRKKRVGNNKDFKRGGISGGQKKRVNIGLELVADPSVLFLDEPTSGLDSGTTASVMRSLKKTAEDASIAVAAVIHQPNQKVFLGFDNLMLIAGSQNGGRTIYFGPTHQAVDYFKSRGFHYDEKEYPNPADFLMDVVGEVVKPSVPTTIETLGEWWRDECDKAELALQCEVSRQNRWKATCSKNGVFCAPVRRWYHENIKSAEMRPSRADEIIKASESHNEDFFQFAIFTHRSTMLAWRIVKSSDFGIVVLLAALIGWIRAMLITTLGDNLIAGIVTNIVLSVVGGLFCVTNALPLIQGERYNIQRELNANVSIHWFLFAKNFVAAGISGIYACIFTLVYILVCNVMLRLRGWREDGKWKDEEGVWVNLTRRWFDKNQDMLTLFFIIWRMFTTGHTCGLLLAALDRVLTLGDAVTMLLAIVVILVLAAVSAISTRAGRLFSFIHVFRNSALILEIGIDTQSVDNKAYERYSHLIHVVKNMKDKVDGRVQRIFDEVSGGKKYITKDDLGEVRKALRLPDRISKDDLINDYGKTPEELTKKYGKTYEDLEKNYGIKKTKQPIIECQLDKGFQRLVAAHGGRRREPFAGCKDAVAAGVFGLCTGHDLMGMTGLHKSNMDVAWSSNARSMFFIGVLQTVLSLCLIGERGLLGLLPGEWPGYVPDGAVQAAIVIFAYITIQGLFESGNRHILMLYDLFVNSIQFLAALVNPQKHDNSSAGTQDIYDERGDDSSVLEICLDTLDLFDSKLKAIDHIQWCLVGEGDGLVLLEDRVKGSKKTKRSAVQMLEAAMDLQRLKQIGSVFGDRVYEVPLQLDDGYYIISKEILEGREKKDVRRETVRRVAARDLRLREWSRWLENQGMQILEILEPYYMALSNFCYLIGTLRVDIELKINEERYKRQENDDNFQAFTPEEEEILFKKIALETLQKEKWLDEVEGLPKGTRTLLLFIASCIVAPRGGIRGTKSGADLLLGCIEDTVGVMIHRTVCPDSKEFAADETEEKESIYVNGVCRLGHRYSSKFKAEVEAMPQTLQDLTSGLSRDGLRLFEVAMDRDFSSGSTEIWRPEDIAAELADLWTRPGGRQEQLRYVFRKLEQAFKAPYRPAAKTLTILSKLLNAALDADWTDEVEKLTFDPQQLDSCRIH